MDLSDIADGAGTPNQLGDSPGSSPEDFDGPKVAPTIQPSNAKQYVAGVYNREVESHNIPGAAIGAGIAAATYSNDSSDLGVTESITVATTIGNLIVLMIIPFFTRLIRRFLHTGQYKVYVSAARCTEEEIIALKTNDILIYRDESGRLCYIVKGVFKKFIREGVIDLKKLNHVVYEELLEQAACSRPGRVNPVSEECKNTFLGYTTKIGHTYSGLVASNSFPRMFRTLSKIFGQVGTILSYFINIFSGPNSPRLTSFILSSTIAVAGGLVAVPLYLFTGKYPDWVKRFKKYCLTGLDSWSKYLRTALAFFMAIGQIVGGIIVNYAKNGGAAATSFGISFWSAVIGLGGVVLVSTLVPLINYISSRVRADKKRILVSPPNDKNKFRNNYPRSGMLFFAFIGAVVGLPWGPVMATICSAAFSVVGGVLFTVFGHRIHKYFHPEVKNKNPQKENRDLENDKGNGIKKDPADIENSSDYVGRAGGSFAASGGAAIACIVNPAGALIWAPVGAAIAGGIGWALAILAMRYARKLPGNEIEKRAETIPWTQRITMWSFIFSTIFSAIGLAVGMAGFVLAGPASVILAVSLFGAIGSLVGGVVGVLSEPLARKLIWQGIKEMFGFKTKAVDISPRLPNSPSPDHSSSSTASPILNSPKKETPRHLSPSSTAYPSSPTASPSSPRTTRHSRESGNLLSGDEGIPAFAGMTDSSALQSTSRVLQAASPKPLRLTAPIDAVPKDPKYRTHRPIGIQTAKNSAFLPFTSPRIEMTSSQSQPKSENPLLNLHGLSVF